MILERRLSIDSDVYGPACVNIPKIMFEVTCPYVILTFDNIYLLDCWLAGTFVYKCVDKDWEVVRGDELVDILSETGKYDNEYDLN